MWQSKSVSCNPIKPRSKVLFKSLVFFIMLDDVIVIYFMSPFLKKKYLTGTEEEREVGEKKAIIKSCRGNITSQGFPLQCCGLNPGS